MAAQLYAPPARPGALDHIAGLRASGRSADADLVEALATQPMAVWVEEGPPEAARAQVTEVIAASGEAVPVLSVYFLPYRDCAQYSAGGALSLDGYCRWIDAVAEGIGDANAIVILETDGLGIIPFYPDSRGASSWCEPVDDDGLPQPGSSPENRFAALRHAAKTLGSLPNTRVYLDGTHSSWLAVSDTVERLVSAGILDTRGFFLNVSNFERDPELIRFGRWVSYGIWWTTCADSPGFGKYSELPDHLEGIESTEAWFVEQVLTHPAFPGDDGVKHFVIDSSRNAHGQWTPPADHPEGDPQRWCNPPGRGAGVRPTLDTGIGLLDAWLWIKIPGESDGEGYRWTEGPLDPARGVEAPAAGDWFDDLALELAKNAVPPLT